MITGKRLALGAATAVLGSGLAMAPAANADSLRGPAPAAASSSDQAAAATSGNSTVAGNWSCELKRGTGWKTCKSGIAVGKGKTLSVELVSSGGKKLNVNVKGNKKKVNPGSGYAISWTNNSSSAKKASVKVKHPKTVSVKANFRHKVT